MILKGVQSTDYCNGITLLSAAIAAEAGDAARVR